MIPCRCEPLPVGGPARVAVLDALEGVLAADAAVQLARMLAAGWPIEAAADALRDWWAGWHRTLVDRAVRETISTRGAP